jgi:predicted permease
MEASMSGRLALGLLRLIARVVPSRDRAAWLQEWEAELAHRRDPRLRSVLGSFFDAAWMRRQFTRDAEIVHDVRHGLRSFGRAPAFAATAILTLALGIGANTAIFSVVNGVLLRPLPYPRPGQLMHLETYPGPRLAFPVAVAEYLEFQQFNRSFAAVGAFRTGESNVMAGDGALRVPSATVDAHLLQALGLRVAQGRLFRSDDSVASGPALPGGGALMAPVVLISHDLWQTAFGGQDVVGTSIEVDGRRLDVIGIMTPGADLMDRHVQIWLPLGFTEAERLARNNHNLTLIGRLRDGITVESAQTELRALIGDWSRRTGITPGGGHAGHVFLGPSGGGGHGLQMVPLADQMLGRVGRSIWALQVAVALVLLIACANVANLLLARSEARQREFAVLTALGAGRGRLLRKVLTESVTLSVAGGALGVVLARAGVEGLILAYPESLPRIGEVTVDLRVMFVSFAVAVLCGVLFGLAPLMHTRPAATAAALKSSPRGSTGSTRHHLRRALVVAETALAVIVVVGAGLLIRTVYNLSTVDIGFDRARLVTFSITLPRTRFDIMGRVHAYQRLLDRLRALPGVQNATAMSSLPLDRPYLLNQTEITNSALDDAPTIPIDYQRVMTGFFETSGVAIVQGRGFVPADAASQGGLTVVNETMASTYWRGRNPIGQRLRPGGTMPWYTVIGVSKDVKQAGVDQRVGPEAYVLVDQVASATLTSSLSISPLTMHFLLRTTVPQAQLSRTITAAVDDLDPAVPVARLREMEDVFAASIQGPRLLAHLLGFFSGLALLLAAIGTYGVLASMVAERRREMGIRLALGANRARLLRQVMTQGLLLGAIGVAAGAAGALVVTRLLTSLLFGVQPADLLTLAIVVPSIVGIAAIASWLPAWRASRLDPTAVLRID